MFVFHVLYSHHHLGRRLFLFVSAICMGERFFRLLIKAIKTKIADHITPQIMGKPPDTSKQLPAVSIVVYDSILENHLVSQISL